MRYRRLFLFGCLGIGIFIAIHSLPANNAGGGGVVGTISQAEWSAIISYDKKALDEAQQADISEMNSDYPGFGDHFKNEFIEGLRLVIDNGDHWTTGPAFFRGQVLIDRFGDWEDANYNAIRNEK